jgi:peptidoglycan/xylan/chitin deacetylase (PgdA/CDA1 family)
MAILQSAKRNLKYSIIRTGLEVASVLKTQSLFPSFGGRGLIFTLHHVRPERQKTRFSPNATLSITPEFLEQAITAARECDLVPVHLHDLPALLANPSDSRKFVSFTLDDGYRDNAEFAAPIFRRFKIPYTIFITPGFVERKRTMWWQTAAALTRKASSFRFDFGRGVELVKSATALQKVAAFERMSAFVQKVDEDLAVRRIDDAADVHRIDPMAIVDNLIMGEAELRDLAGDPLVHFGAHTMTHVNLRRVSAERLQREIRESADVVERYAGRRPQSFCYPYGFPSAVSDREISAAAEAGFPVAVTTQPGVLSAASSERPTGMPRVSLNGSFQKKHYVKALISGLPFRFI